ncbi:uncharacterized protein LOC121392071 [Gigantopelta aegis]|uniref:uncharacterized protein LOC121392071 n=1 Tax=Gigantopelta aegis TaxID=1735272 RepID=UPI001B888C1F|nr:uncharacterized protein LOC121392071 [Gigantopelta aegis]
MDNVRDVTQSTHIASSKTPVGGVPEVTQRAHRPSSKTPVEGVPDVMQSESTISLNKPVVMLMATIIAVFVVLLFSCLAKYIYVLHTRKERKNQETAEQEPLSSGTLTSHTYAEIDEINTSVSGQRPFETPARQSNMATSALGHDIGPQNQSVSQTRRTLSTGAPDLSSMYIHQARPSNMLTSGDLRVLGHAVGPQNHSFSLTHPTLSTATPDVSSMCIHQARQSNVSTSSGYLAPLSCNVPSDIQDQRTADNDACSKCIQPVASLGDDATVFNQDEFKAQPTIPNIWASSGCLRRLRPRPALSTVDHSVSSMHIHPVTSECDISDRVDFKSRATVANGSTPARCEGPSRRQQLRLANLNETSACMRFVVLRHHNSGCSVQDICKTQATLPGVLTLSSPARHMKRLNEKFMIEQRSSADQVQSSIPIDPIVLQGRDTGRPDQGVFQTQTASSNVATSTSSLRTQSCNVVPLPLKAREQRAAEHKTSINTQPDDEDHLCQSECKPYSELPSMSRLTVSGRPPRFNGTLRFEECSPADRVHSSDYIDPVTLQGHEVASPDGSRIKLHATLPRMSTSARSVGPERCNGQLRNGGFTLADSFQTSVYIDPTKLQHQGIVQSHATLPRMSTRSVRPDI